MRASVLTDIDTRGIARITLNRPERRNAFDDVMIGELHAALEAVAQSTTLRVAVLGGAGPAFCAGADLGWMRDMAAYTPEENLADAQQLANLLQRLDTLPVPTVALVQGAAFGGALGLLCCCDVVIAADSAKFCFSEVRLGLSPATISPYVVATIGARQARRYFLTAEAFGSDQAVHIGLAHETVAEANLAARGEEVLKVLLAGRPQAQAEAKRLVAEALYRPIDADFIAQTSRRIADRRAHPEAQAALATFLARR